MYIQPPRFTYKGPNGSALVIELYKHEDEKLSDVFQHRMLIKKLRN